MPELEQWLGAALGSGVALVKDWSWRDGKSSVAEVADQSGRRWFVKRHLDQEWFDAEVNAYGRWVPALGDRAPTLETTNDELRALVLSALPSDDHLDWHDERVRRDGGAALRQLHGSESFGICDDLAAEKTEELDKWINRGTDLFTKEDLDIARAAVRSLAAMRPPERVPCHRDFTPRNWVVSAGRVQVIDFEEMRPEAWVVDFARMAIGWWREEPHLIEPVFDGYGRTPSAEDLHVMRCCFAVTAARLIVIANHYNKGDFATATREALHYLRNQI